jgi:hypothetical protein
MNIGSVLVGAGAAALPAAPSAAGTTGGAVAAAIARAATSPVGGTAGSAVAAWLGSLSQTSLQRTGEQFGDLLTRFVRGGVAGLSSGTQATSTTGSSSSSASSSLAFLKDARLSVEEKLARLMVHLSDKYEKQLDQKVQQYADLEGGKATSNTTKKSSSSGSKSTSLGDGVSALLSGAGLGKLLGSATGQKLVGQVAGPVLAGAATALGMPALAPVLLKSGPLVASVVSGAVGALSSGGSTTSSKAASSSSTSSAAPSEKQLMTEIQILQEKQKEMFALVSNILRSLHDTKMAVIGNIR